MSTRFCEGGGDSSTCEADSPTREADSPFATVGDSLATAGSAKASSAHLQRTRFMEKQKAGVTNRWFPGALRLHPQGGES
eukprot:1182071-Prorocentrum_minimum.AAC.1